MDGKSVSIAERLENEGSEIDRSFTSKISALTYKFYFP